MKPEFHVKGFDKMPKATQEALAELAGCIVANLEKVPKGFDLLRPGIIVKRGDFWHRPTDWVWIETGTAQWATTVARPFQYCRKRPSTASPRKS